MALNEFGDEEITSQVAPQAVMEDPFAEVKKEADPFAEERVYTIDPFSDPNDKNVEIERSGIIDTVRGMGRLPTGEEMYSLVRPTLQGLGAAGGFIIGSGAGIVGAPAGGAIGYAIGDELADLLDQMRGMREQKPLLLELSESAREIGEAGIFEGLGGPGAVKEGARLLGKVPIVGAASKWAEGKVTQAAAAVWNALPKGQQGAQLKAGQVLIAQTDKGPIVLKNIEDADYMLQKIPGLKLNLAQLTDDPGAVKLVQGAKESIPQFASQQKQIAADNTALINDYIEKAKGRGTTEDIKALGRKRKGEYQKLEDITADELETARQPFEVDYDPKQVGATLRGEYEVGEKAAKDKATELFEAVPEKSPQDVTTLYKRLADIIEPRYTKEPKDRVPKILRDFVEKKRNELRILKKKTGGPAPKFWAEPGDVREMYGAKYYRIMGDHPSVGKDLSEQQLKKMEVPIFETPPAKGTISPKESIKDLHLMRSDVLEDLREAEQRKYSTKYIQRLKDAAAAFTEQIQKMSGGKELREAEEYFAENVIERFHKGTGRAVGIKEGALKDVNIADKFFMKGGAGQQAAVDFKKTYKGSKPAKKALGNHIKQKFLSLVENSKTGQVTSGNMRKFMKDYKYALKELNLTKKFDNVQNAQKAFEEALIQKEAFNKSALAAAIDTDPEALVSALLTGKAKGAQAKQLMKQLKGNDQAIDGLQNAMVDEILTKAGVTDAMGTREARELLTSKGMTDNLRTYDEALKEIFPRGSRKLKAMREVRSVMQMIERTPTLQAGTPKEQLAKGVGSLARRYGMTPTAVKHMVAEGLYKAVKGVSNRKIGKLLAEATVNPKLADDLMFLAKSGATLQAKVRLRNRLLTLGYMSTQQED